MKKILVTFFIILNTITIAAYCEFPKLEHNSNVFIESISANALNGAPAGVLTINQFDSVFFDVSQAVINGSTVEFPVYFRSDDVINALDFAFKYDHSHLEYDTIINLTNYIDPLAYYNPNDSVVRLTSYSFTQPYANDTPLFIVRFTLLSGQLCNNDLDSVSSLLNGDAATFLVSDCTSGLLDSLSELQISLFPNPATDLVSFVVPYKATIEVVNISSKKLVSAMIVESPGTHSINTTDLPNGIYVIRFAGENYHANTKFVICR